jgi:hypothetical protein
MYLDSTSPLICKSVREVLNQTLREVDAETVVRAETGYLIDKRSNKEQALINDESLTTKRKVKIDRLNRGSYRC